MGNGNRTLGPGFPYLEYGTTDEKREWDLGMGFVESGIFCTVFCISAVVWRLRFLAVEHELWSKCERCDGDCGNLL